MSTNHLLRHHAPISDRAWGELDEDAAERLRSHLGARRLVDFSGPKGWEFSAIDLGRVEKLDTGAGDGSSGAVQRRLVLPVIEVRHDFSISRAELLNVDRGAPDVDLGPLEDAAWQMAVTENRAIFHGWSEAGITGVTEASSYDPIGRPDDFDDYPSAVAAAVTTLRRGGIGGPYAIALGVEDYTSLVETTEDGYPIADHVKKILDGPIVWAPGIDGAVVLSARGGDFEFHCGQDISVGYHHHDADSVHLYLEESFGFRVTEPDAAVAISGA